jgi:hypothetical protein
MGTGPGLARANSDHPFTNPFIYAVMVTRALYVPSFLLFGCRRDNKDAMVRVSEDTRGGSTYSLVVVTVRFGALSCAGTVF